MYNQFICIITYNNVLNVNNTLTIHLELRMCAVPVTARYRHIHTHDIVTIFVHNYRADIVTAINHYHPDIVTILTR